jgi:excinuclease ABC subunit A
VHHAFNLRQLVPLRGAFFRTVQVGQRFDFYGSKGEKIEILVPPGARQGEQHAGKKMPFQGIIPQIERNYRWYRKQGSSRDGMEEYLQKVMVDYDCPDCGGARLRKTRSLVRVGGKTLPEAGDLHLRELQKWLGSLDLSADKTAVAGALLPLFLA